MAFGYVDGCMFTTGATGTSDFTDGTALARYKNMSTAGCVNGVVYSYRAESLDGSQWEEGSGAYASGTTTLARTTVSASSNANAKVNFSGSPRVSITLMKVSLDGLLPIGLADFELSCAGAVPRTTNGSTPYKSELATNDVMLAGQEFSASVEQACQWSFAVPKGVNPGASLSGDIRWTTIAGSSGNCIWGIRARATGNDDAMDGSWGTAVEVTDTFLAAGDDHVIAFSALTPGGSWAQGDKLWIELYRKAADGSDTLNGTSIAMDVKMSFTTNAGNDN